MKLNKKGYILLFIIILIIVIFGMILLIPKKDPSKVFYGLWTTDGYTVYEFTKDGKGNLIIPSQTYSFSYEIEENKICIDFKNESTIDRCYEYEITNEELILKSDEGYEHKFTRKED